jgi:DNA helicase-2/ATP-dependent DNA helicase PcrA
MKDSGLPEYLAILNPEQREAVFHRGNPLLILAGAGSGKTRVITTKIAYLIRERSYDPRSIMAVTFTNKAAREMAARARFIDERAELAMMRTFHSFGAWFLRRNAGLAALNPGFVIYDDDDTVSLLGTLLEDRSKAELREIAARISRAKDYFLSPDDPELDRIDHRPEFRKTYALYEEKLQRIGNVDFGDLIKRPVEILRNNPQIAGQIRDRFQVIMVDEYQDSNVAQFRLLWELKGEHTYLCVVGDDDQSIYRFRGAEVKNILEFSRHFPGTDIIRLERNYRSYASILRAASSVVDHNKGRLGKILRAERGEGKLPTLAFLPDQDEEATFCAELISRSIKAGTSAGGGAAVYSDWAILYRTNAQSLGFETELLRRRIPYKVVGSLKFYEREEIKDALALLALLANPLDEVAFRRVINKPPRGIGWVSMEKILALPPRGGSILAAAEGLALSAKAKAGIEVFAGVMARGALPEKPPGEGAAGQPPPGQIPPEGSGNRAQALLKAGEGLSLCVAGLVLDSGLAEYHVSQDEINGTQRINNLQELVNAASLYPANREGLLEFLEHIELDRSIEEANTKEHTASDSVTLITLHNTKGLEFKRVILTGLEQGVFPRDDKEGEDLEEERRLFYVGATRAMDELYITSCTLRRMYGRTIPMAPSLFLCEVDTSALRVIGRAPDGAAAFRTGRASGPGAKTSSDGRWTVGNRVYHDDQGYGEVGDIAEGEDGPVVLVRFDNGRERRFLSRYQSGNFTRIGPE